MRSTNENNARPHQHWMAHKSLQTGLRLRTKVRRQCARILMVSLPDTDLLIMLTLYRANFQRGTRGGINGKNLRFLVWFVWDGFESFTYSRKGMLRTLWPFQPLCSVNSPFQTKPYGYTIDNSTRALTLALDLSECNCVELPIKSLGP